MYAIIDHEKLLDDILKVEAISKRLKTANQAPALVRDIDDLSQTSIDLKRHLSLKVGSRGEDFKCFKQKRVQTMSAIKDPKILDYKVDKNFNSVKKLQMLGKYLFILSSSIKCFYLEHTVHKELRREGFSYTNGRPDTEWFHRFDEHGNDTLPSILKIVQEASAVDYKTLE